MDNAIKTTIANQLESLVHSHTSLYALKEKIRMRVGTYGEVDFADDVGESVDFELNFCVGKPSGLICTMYYTKCREEGMVYPTEVQICEG